MNIQKIIAGCKQRIIAKISDRKTNNVFILMLHEVTDTNEPLYPEISITKNNFSALLDRILQKDIKIVHISEFFKKHKKQIVITFDDIFESAFINAFPLLEEKGIPYTVFISSEYIDKPNYITSSQLEQLKKSALCTVGFHGKNHVMMRELSNDDILQNISPKDFESEFNIKCDYFAFPYGSVYACPKRAYKMASFSGYRYVFSTVNASVSSKRLNKKNYFVPRLCVSDSSWKQLLKKL